MIRQIGIILLTVIVINGCEIPKNNNTDEQVADQTEQLMQGGNKQVGMPNINNWYEKKKLVRDLYELRDQEDLITYTYIINMHGEKIFLGKSIGYGIPASVQFSNPKKTVGRYHNEGIEQLPQPEPNGLFMPEGLSATWIMLIDDNGNPRATYVEPEILVSPVKLH